MPTQEVLDLADEARRHADEGKYMGLFDWLHGSVRLATCSWASAGELTEERRLQTNRRSRLYVSCRLMASRLWPAGLGLANRTYIGCAAPACWGMNAGGPGGVPGASVPNLRQPHLRLCQDVHHRGRDRGEGLGVGVDDARCSRPAQQYDSGRVWRLM